MAISFAAVSKRGENSNLMTRFTISKTQVDQENSIYTVGFFPGQGGPEAAEYTNTHLPLQITNEVQEISPDFEHIFYKHNNTMKNGWRRWPKHASGHNSISGTSSTVAIVQQNSLKVVHAGNSVAYVVKTGESDFVRVATANHSLEDTNEQNRINLMQSGAVQTKIFRRDNTPYETMALRWDKTQCSCQPTTVDNHYATEDDYIVCPSHGHGYYFSHSSKSDLIVPKPSVSTGRNINFSEKFLVFLSSDARGILTKDILEKYFRRVRNLEKDDHATVLVRQALSIYRGKIAQLNKNKNAHKSGREFLKYDTNKFSVLVVSLDALCESETWTGDIILHEERLNQSQRFIKTKYLPTSVTVSETSLKRLNDDSVKYVLDNAALRCLKKTILVGRFGQITGRPAKLNSLSATSPKPSRTSLDNPHAEPSGNPVVFSTLLAEVEKRRRANHPAPEAFNPVTDSSLPSFDEWRLDFGGTQTEVETSRNGGIAVAPPTPTSTHRSIPATITAELTELLGHPSPNITTNKPVEGNGDVSETESSNTADSSPSTAGSSPWEPNRSMAEPEYQVELVADNNDADGGINKLKLKKLPSQRFTRSRINLLDRLERSLRTENRVGSVQTPSPVQRNPSGADGEISENASNAHPITCNHTSPVTDFPVPQPALAQAAMLGVDIPLIPPLINRGGASGPRYFECVGLNFIDAEARRPREVRPPGAEGMPNPQQNLNPGQNLDSIPQQNPQAVPIHRNNHAIPGAENIIADISETNSIASNESMFDFLIDDIPCDNDIVEFMGDVDMTNFQKIDDQVQHIAPNDSTVVDPIDSNEVPPPPEEVPVQRERIFHGLLGHKTMNYINLSWMSGVKKPEMHILFRGDWNEFVRRMVPRVEVRRHETFSDLVTTNVFLDFPRSSDFNTSTALNSNVFHTSVYKYLQAYEDIQCDIRRKWDEYIEKMDINQQFKFDSANTLVRLLSNSFVDHLNKLSSADINLESVTSPLQTSNPEPEMFTSSLPCGSDLVHVNLDDFLGPNVAGTTDLNQIQMHSWESPEKQPNKRSVYYLGQICESEINNSQNNASTTSNPSFRIDETNDRSPTPEIHNEPNLPTSDVQFPISVITSTPETNVSSTISESDSLTEENDRFCNDLVHHKAQCKNASDTTTTTEEANVHQATYYLQPCTAIAENDDELARRRQAEMDIFGDEISDDEDESIYHPSTSPDEFANPCNATRLVQDMPNQETDESSSDDTSSSSSCGGSDSESSSDTDSDSDSDSDSDMESTASLQPNVARSDYAVPTPSGRLKPICQFRDPGLSHSHGVIDPDHNEETVTTPTNQTFNDETNKLQKNQNLRNQCSSDHSEEEIGDMGSNPSVRVRPFSSNEETLSSDEDIEEVEEHHTTDNVLPSTVAPVDLNTANVESQELNQTALSAVPMVIENSSGQASSVNYSVTNKIKKHARKKRNQISETSSAQNEVTGSSSIPKKGWDWGLRKLHVDQNKIHLNRNVYADAEAQPPNKLPRLEDQNQAVAVQEADAAVPPVLRAIQQRKTHPMTGNKENVPLTPEEEERKKMEDLIKKRGLNWNPVSYSLYALPAASFPFKIPPRRLINTSSTNTESPGHCSSSVVRGSSSPNPNGQITVEVPVSIPVLAVQQPVQIPVLNTDVTPEVTPNSNIAPALYCNLSMPDGWF